LTRANIQANEKARLWQISRHVAAGNLFPWIFNAPATYWDGASAFIRYAADVEGGFDKLKGKKIGLVHLDAPYGKEPIPLLQALAQDYGFELRLYPVPAPQMQNQSSLWLDVRRDRLDWILSARLGRHEPDRGQGSHKRSTSRWIE
jgi:branched-chain amino acid transport system substrate-binding protein